MDTVLSTLIQEKVRRENISIREAARRVGVSATTISRTMEGESVDVETLIKICDWLGVSPSNVIDSYLPSTDGLGKSVAAILETNPKLAEVFGEAIQRIAMGELPPDTLRDIVAYARYRLDLEVGNEENKTNIRSIERD
jgi:transcriptional regulator with XRE-family HTH domain